MITELHIKHQYFHQKLLILWIGFTVFCVALLTFYQWQHVRSQVTTQFERDANHFAFKFDEIIENILTSFDSGALYSKNRPSCEELLPHLQSIVFNNFYIAGIVINDLDNNFVCETAVSDRPLPAPLSKDPTLFGPLKINKTSNNVFLLQTHLGQYHVGIYILEQFFADLFRYSASKFQMIALYDTNQKKMIFHTGKEISNPAVFLERLSRRAKLINTSGDNEIVVPLQNLDNIDLVITSPRNLIKPLALNLSLQILPLLFFFWLFYTYYRRMMNKRFSLAYALESALKSNQFYPVYQPVRDESKDAFCGAEVLIRWRTDFNEVVMPDYFIHEAEKSGLIVPITLQLMKKALRECQPLFHTNSDFRLSFNLTPVHFKNERFFNNFYNLCIFYNIRPQQIMLELTERELFNEVDTQVTAQMNELRAKGFSLALDDFGTGQANINYLQHFPFNYIKIDKLFISTIGTGAITEALNQGIINMAHSLGLEVIAEGVESKIQLDYLRKNDVNYIQGWFYARDMPYKHFAELLKHPTKDSK
ncbi:MAG: EAL domain-containing protein [Legionella sp.]|nr:EAL domain-containing protein [Legionella sp.]